MQQGSTQPQHQPADGPAFWNITHDFKPGELESDLSKMFFNQALDLHKENEALKRRIKRLEEELNELRSDEARLLNSNGELERRIKRLESDAISTKWVWMMNYCKTHGISPTLGWESAEKAWTAALEAKESKP